MAYLIQIHFPGDNGNRALTDTVHTKLIAYLHEILVMFIWHTEVNTDGRPVLHVAFYDSERSVKKIISHYNALKVESGLYTPLTYSNCYDAF